MREVLECSVGNIVLARGIAVRKVVDNIFNLTRRFKYFIVEFNTRVFASTSGRNGPGLRENCCSYVTARSSTFSLAENVKPSGSISGSVAGVLLRRLLFSL